MYSYFLPGTAFPGLTHPSIQVPKPTGNFSGVHRSVQALERDIRAWVHRLNGNPRLYVWAKTADQILGSLAAYDRRITDQGHYSPGCWLVPGLRQPQ